MKKVLVLEYSQTGQLTSVLNAMLEPLAGEPEILVHRERLRPRPEYPFPWPFWKFLDTFPETVAGPSPVLEPLSIAGRGDWDLVILGFPVWFLSPAPMFTALLRSQGGRDLLRDRPVVTVTACRNMWLGAQDKMKALLKEAGARHCDHVVLVDKAPPLASFITTPHWLFTGRRQAGWGLPPAGVADGEIRACRRFGLALRAALAAGDEKRHAPLLWGLRACAVDPRLIASERVGRRVFAFWSWLLRAAGKPGAPARRVLLAVFLVTLVGLIVTVLPISMLLKLLLRPLIRRKLDALQRDYELPSGSDGARLSLFCG